ncbi:hypothetical protein Cni_G18926 [Canna indica]|uniref:Uncharacterized protein n=1 Tax=Canna indica TaxID=4628 RepID=A0AAQ3KQC5_9LILI|nr:hypothetical protein Cni_G18926 [Canna indica]
MVDMAILLADRGARVSFISNPVNAARAAAGARAGVSIDFVELPFPCAAVGLPDGCENLDLLPSLESHHVELFFSAAALLRDPLKQYLLAQPPSPACMIADACNLGPGSSPGSSRCRGSSSTAPPACTPCARA